MDSTGWLGGGPITDFGLGLGLEKDSGIVSLFGDQIGEKFIPSFFDCVLIGGH